MQWLRVGCFVTDHFLINFCPATTIREGVGGAVYSRHRRCGELSETSYLVLQEIAEFTILIHYVVG